MEPGNPFTKTGLPPCRFFVCTLIVWLIWAMPAPAAGQTGSARAQKAPAAPVPEMISAQPSRIEKVINGFTRARTKMKVVSEVSARCLAVLADVGQETPPDGVFARLDDTFIRLEHQANLAEQNRIKARLDYWQKEALRYRRLVKTKSESQSRLDSLETDLQQARLQLKSLQIQGDILAERLKRHEVRAPAGWRVISRSVEPGQWVATGEVLAELGNYNTLLVPLALSPPELQALEAMPGPYELKAPYQHRTLKARLERINPAFDPVTRKTKLELAVDSGLAQMRGGVQVELRLILPDPSGAVLVPAEALQSRYQEKWLTKKDGSQVQAVDLGPGPGGLRRVVSPQVRPGDLLRLVK